MKRCLKFRSVLGLTMLSCCLCGCSVMKTGPGEKSWMPSWFKRQYETPQTMSVIWSPDVLTTPGKPATRGFGGRVFFYNAKSQAIPVEGDLIVHGYLGDPAERGYDQTSADKTFAFTAEQLTGHFSPSQLGASYSIWIPWDAADGYQQRITLIPSFRLPTGGIVAGAPATLALPGRSQTPPPPANIFGGSASGLPAQTVSFQRSTTPTNPGIELPKVSGMNTTTIQVPPNASLNKSRKTERLTFELHNRAIATGSGQPVSVGGQSPAKPQTPPQGTQPAPVEFSPEPPQAPESAPQDLTPPPPQTRSFSSDRSIFHREPMRERQPPTNRYR